MKRGKKKTSEKKHVGNLFPDQIPPKKKPMMETRARNSDNRRVKSSQQTIRTGDNYSSESGVAGNKVHEKKRRTMERRGEGKFGGTSVMKTEGDDSSFVRA